MVMNPGIISTMIKRWGRGYTPARRKSMSALVSTGWIVVLKVRSSEHCVYQRSFQRFSEVNIIFIIITKISLPLFSWNDICTDDTKALVGSTAEALARTKAVVPDCTRSHCILFPCTCRGGKSQFYLEKPLIKQ